MRNPYPDGLYWTHPTYGPSSRAAWRKTKIDNGFVEVPNTETGEFVNDAMHRFTQPFFFEVNTMVGKVEDHP